MIVSGSTSLREQIYHVFMLGLVAHLAKQYTIKSNREAGAGRCDLLLIPNNPNGIGVIMEFKSIQTPVLKQSTDTPLEQDCIEALQ